MPYHQHKRQDEFIYVLQGTPVLVTDTGETQLSPGMCAPSCSNRHHRDVAIPIQTSLLCLH
jgi:uncharacterized cupin superfamily protein